MRGENSLDRGQVSASFVLQSSADPIADPAPEKKSMQNQKDKKGPWISLSLSSSDFAFCHMAGSKSNAANTCETD
jgi:hypothetical protein